ncbi:MAG: 5'-nucleotidase C-terminal domain-containing protein [Pseudomonadota bacterium]
MSYLMSAAISRRLVLRAGAVVAATAAAPKLAFGQNAPDVTAIILSDMHSPYRRLAQLVAAVRNRVAQAGGRAIIVINGDQFERGNVVALRSRVSADLVALEKLTQIAPVYFNIGNHETAVLEDMAIFTREAEARGVNVLSNIIDARTGELIAPAAMTLNVFDKKLAITGLATDNIFTYRAPVRPTLRLPKPVAWARSVMPSVTRDADAALVISHAGVAADKNMLDLLPARTLLIGGHDHLNFTHETDTLAYVHPGSWGNGFTVASMTFNADGGADTTLEYVDVNPDDDVDSDVGNAVATALEEHLTDEDKAVVGTMPETFDLAQSILFASEAMRAATDADIAFIGHTTFGTGLEVGPVTQYDFNAFVRFDGDLQTTTVSGEQLLTILERTNQHTATSLDQRTGDFVYAAELDVDPEATYTIATNGWTVRNQTSYLGTEDLEFSQVEGLQVKQVIADAIAAL